MAIRVVHWGTGATGRMALGAILERADFELVGLYVTNPAKAGRDAGELIDRPAVGIAASQDLDGLIALKPDVVTYFGNGVADPAGTARNIARFLEAGINVVTTSIAHLISRETAPPEILAIIDPAIEAGQSSLYSSGIDPGFATSQLSVTAFSVAHRIDQVRLQEFANYGSYPDPHTMREIWGFGKPLDVETPVSQGLILKHMWAGTLEENARALAIEVERLETRYYGAPAKSDRDTVFGTVEAGSTSAVWFQLIGIEKGEEKIILEHINWVHIDDVPADWPAPPKYRGEPSPVSYRNVITGDPSFDLELQLPSNVVGRMMTAMHVVNAIPLVTKSPPGILNQAHLPPYGTGPIRSDSSD